VDKKQGFGPAFCFCATRKFLSFANVPFFLKFFMLNLRPSQDLLCFSRKRLAKRANWRYPDASVVLNSELMEVS
jgi:hypothetical protein